MHQQNLTHKIQFGFSPQTSTIDAAMAVKEIIEDNLKQNKYVVLVALDVKGAFDASWWPSILCLSIYLTRKIRPDKNKLGIYVNNRQLENVDTLKYLGIILDEKH